KAAAAPGASRRTRAECSAEPAQPAPILRRVPHAPVLRPMTEADVAAVHEVAMLAFEDLAARKGQEPDRRPDPAVAHIRLRHLLGTDPGGSWVAESDGGIVGCALGILREGVWGLSLLVVRPDAQSA